MSHVDQRIGAHAPQFALVMQVSGHVFGSTCEGHVAISFSNCCGYSGSFCFDNWRKMPTPTSSQIDVPFQRQKLANEQIWRVNRKEFLNALDALVDLPWNLNKLLLHFRHKSVSLLTFLEDFYCTRCIEIEMFTIIHLQIYPFV